MKLKIGLLFLPIMVVLSSLACKAAVSNQSAEATVTALPVLATAAILPTKEAPAATTPQVSIQPSPTILSAPPLSPVFTPALPPTPTNSLPTLAPTALPVAVAPEVTARQMSVFEELRRLIQENYLYRDFNGLNFEAVTQDYQARISAGMNDEQFYEAMLELIHRLGDEHSTYFSPEEAREMDLEFEGQASYVGIGVMTALISERGVLSVLLVFPGSPAEAAGIRPHDTILSVDGQLLVDESGSRLSLLRGPEGTAINVAVRTPGQEPRTVNITRRAVNSSMPVPALTITSPNGKRIGYIYVPTFLEADIDERVGQALSDLSAQAPLDGLILDNRYNGGGANDVTLNTMSYFTTGPVGYFVQKEGETVLDVAGRDVGGSQQIPLVVLVGEGTASFGEVFAGSLKDLGRAHIIGQITTGNVEVMRVFNLSDGSRAWIASATFRPFNDPNQNWESTGIVPDQVVESSWDLVTFETDPVIQSALAHFDAQ